MTDDESPSRSSPRSAADAGPAPLPTRADGDIARIAEIGELHDFEPPEHEMPEDEP